MFGGLVMLMLIPFGLIVIFVVLGLYYKGYFGVRVRNSTFINYYNLYYRGVHISFKGLTTENIDKAILEAKEYHANRKQRKRLVKADKQYIKTFMSNYKSD